MKSVWTRCALASFRFVSTSRRRSSASAAIRSAARIGDRVFDPEACGVSPPVDDRVFDASDSARVIVILVPSVL